MNSEEQFRKSLNDKLSSKEFKFEESDWESAKKLIDDSKKKKKRFFFYLIFGGIAFIVGVSSLLTYSAKNNSIASQSKQRTQTGSERLISTVSPSVNSEVSAVKPISKLQKNTSTVQTTNSLSAPIKSLSHSSLQVNPHMEISEAAATQVNEAGNAVKELKLTTTTNTKTSVNSATKVIPQLNGEEKNNNSTVLPSLGITAVEKAPISNQLEVAKQNSGSVDEKVTIALAAVAPKEKDIMLEDNSSHQESDTLISSKTDLIGTTDSIQTAVIAKPDTDYVRRKKPNLSFEAGLTYNMGWKSAELKEGSGFTPVIGINYLNAINPKLMVGLGLQYGSISKLQYSTYTSKITKLGLGEESEVSKFTPNVLHYLIVPCRLEYKNDLYNSFGIGCNVGYLFTVSSKLETYTQTYSGTSNHANQKVSGYNDGFSKYDFQLTALYRRKIYAHFYAKAELFVGLTTTKDLSFFSSQVKGKNSGIKITLMYDIFKNY